VLHSEPASSGNQKINLHFHRQPWFLRLLCSLALATTPF